MKKQSVLISILNWNNAGKTLSCVSSLDAEIRNSELDVRILVLDNGSRVEDFSLLKEGVSDREILVKRLDKNLGFTGGHNISITMAIEESYDYIWLLNNDAEVEQGTLGKLVSAISADARCGAVSPVIDSGIKNTRAAGCGGVHDWKNRATNWATSKAEAQDMHKKSPEIVFVSGTAILLRVEALRQTGGLDDRLFAYYDDNDISARLEAFGWRSKIVFDATVHHGARELRKEPDYFFYLVYRNELIFWNNNMPKQYRRFLWLKLVYQAFFNVNRLYRQNLAHQADVALLGVWDFIVGRFGEPKLDRQAPWIMRGACKILAMINAKELLKRDEVGTSA